VGGEALLGHLSARRSCRFFMDDPLSAEDMERLLSAAGYSPTGKNAGGLTVRVVSGRDRVEELCAELRRFLRVACLTGMPQLAAAGAGLGDALKRLRRGEDLIFREAPAVLFFHVSRSNAMRRTDGVIAATHVMVHAGTLGISTLWNGFAQVLYPLVRRWHSKETRGTVLAAVLCAGYPSREPLWRLPPRDFRTVSD
jgi:nitroreductase